MNLVLEFEFEDMKTSSTAHEKKRVAAMSEPLNHK